LSRKFYDEAPSYIKRQATLLMEKKNIFLGNSEKREVLLSLKTHKVYGLTFGVMGLNLESLEGDTYDPIYQKLDNKTKVFND